jgi:hypothetical protein
MKRILSCSLVLSFCLLLSFPAVADAFLGRGKDTKAEQLSGTYIHTEQQQMTTPNQFFEFSSGSYTARNRLLGNSQGKFSITGDNIEFVSSDGKIDVFRFSRTPNAITLTSRAATDIFVRATSEQVAAIAAAPKEGFIIAVSDTAMNWADAKAWCEQQGGRLPRINDSDSWAWNDRDKITRIEGFGAPGASWPSSLPLGNSWTGTESTGSTGGSWVVGVFDGNVFVNVILQSRSFHVVCVP